MSSALLYLAIVAVWAVVLVPMWLRRDGEGLSRLLHRRNETEEEAETPLLPAVDDDQPLAELAELAEEEPEPVRHPRPRRSRAAVIARRRRRTLGLGLLLLTSIGIVAGGLTPWWFVLPPAALFAGHLSLLRVAVKMDAVRRHERRMARLEAQRRAHARLEAQRARAAEQAAAEVIAMPARPRDEVYDQYADRRAVGD